MTRSAQPLRKPGDKPLGRWPRHEVLKELRPSNPLYTKLVSYRHYRLKFTDQERTGRETGKVKDHVRRLELTLRDEAFDGSDPVRVLPFLSAFVAEADVMEMTEAQAYIALPYVIKGTARQHFTAVKGVPSSSGGVTCWPEAVQYPASVSMADLRGLKLTEKT